MGRNLFEVGVDSNVDALMSQPCKTTRRYIQRFESTSAWLSFVGLRTMTDAIDPGRLLRYFLSSACGKEITFVQD
jgi:hypothetical protein